MCFAIFFTIIQRGKKSSSKHKKNKKNGMTIGKRHPCKKVGSMQAPLFIGFRRLFASGQIPNGKIFGGEANASTITVPGWRSGTKRVCCCAQIFLHCPVCPSGEKTSDRMNRDTLAFFSTGPPSIASTAFAKRSPVFPFRMLPAAPAKTKRR